MQYIAAASEHCSVQNYRLYKNPTASLTPLNWEEGVGEAQFLHFYALYKTGFKKKKG